MSAHEMKRWHAPVSFVALWFLLANLIQSEEFLAARSFRGWFAIGYMGLHGVCMALLIAVLWRDRKSDRPLMRRIKDAVARVPMPRMAKVLVGGILCGQLVCITFGVTYYPFADVGMFRWTRKFRELPPVLVQPQYYFKDADGKPHVVHLRKQHVWAMADLLGWGYNNEYTFSAAYHYKGRKAAYEFLLDALRREQGVDTLWMGLYSVDFRTGEVAFDPDPVRAAVFNDSARIHYGPLYLPDHQRVFLLNSDEVAR